MQDPSTSLDDEKKTKAFKKNQLLFPIQTTNTQKPKLKAQNHL